MSRLLLRLAWLLDWLNRLLRRAGATTVRHPGAIKGQLACEACEQRVATEPVWSDLEQREVWFCDWCFRRFKKRNQARAIPRTRKPKKRGGRPGGRAA